MAFSKGTARTCKWGIGGALMVCAHLVMAQELYQGEQVRLSADLEAMFGVFHSDRNYNQFGNRQPGTSDWQEGYLKYGVSGEYASGFGNLYGKVNLLSSATWGDGDSAGFSEGDERTTKFEDAYVGWRSADLVGPAKDFLDVSTGRQLVMIGDGFLIAGDGLDMGNGPAGGSLNRGGTYYLGARKDFDRTAVLKVGGDGPVLATMAWIQSDNRAQAKGEFAVADLAWHSNLDSLALTWVRGLGVDQHWASEFQAERDGMEIYSVRGSKSLGRNLVVSGNYAYQDRQVSRESAWYAQLDYTFSDVAWTPVATYRLARYSDQWDAFFTGYATGYGTWFQGENAGSYAGPFNSNTRVQHVGLKASPTETLRVGALYFDFQTLDKGYTPDFGGKELDLYLEWAAMPNLVVMPLVGLYRPDAGADNGGVQLGSAGTTTYAHLMVYTTF